MNRTLPLLTASLALAAAGTASAAVIDLPNGDLEVLVDGSPLGFTVAENAGFAGVNNDGGALSGNFVFLGNGGSISTEAASQLAVTPGDTVEVIFDGLGFGNAADNDYFLSVFFLDAAGSGVGTFDSASNIANNTVIAVSSGPLTVPDNAATVGFNLFGAAGISVDNFRADVTSVPIPEPGSLALLGLGGVALLRRRKG